MGHADARGLVAHERDPGFRMSGKLHDEDYKKFVPLVDDAIAKHGKVRFLAEFHEFKNRTSR
jgi:SpoIIAA-like